MSGYINNITQTTVPQIRNISGIDGLKLIQPKVLVDDRGYLVESYNIEEWPKQLGFNEIFKQDNHLFSKQGVLRGLYIQPKMGKLVSVIFGKIFNVAVDARPDSKTYGKWHAEILDENGTHFWIPDGFLHGFYTMSADGAYVAFKCTDVQDPRSEFGVNPFDPEIGIDWPFLSKDKIIVSDHDRSYGTFRSIIEKFDVLL
uniref:Thymidine diphospho-4-keto-rhamnose 3,5-epimerase n=1 Tax=Syphacia muris TaxID=451379 RepID=A0A0N5AWT8_9BILA